MPIHVSLSSMAPAAAAIAEYDPDDSWPEVGE